MLLDEPRDPVLRALPLTIGIEEIGGPNAGRAVELIQKSTGNSKGDPWCASFVYRVGSQMLGAGWKLPRTGSCDALLLHAKHKAILSDTPEPGAVFLLLKSPTDAVHTGFVTGVNPGEVECIEGNTNPAGGREGYGVFRRTRPINSKYKYIHWWAL